MKASAEELHSVSYRWGTRPTQLARFQKVLLQNTDEISTGMRCGPTCLRILAQI